MTDVDDGSDKPLGYQTSDGELEVRVDTDGRKIYHETELGQHQRWMRSAPDLFEQHQAALAEIARQKAEAIAAHERYLRQMTETARLRNLQRSHETGCPMWMLKCECPALDAAPAPPDDDVYIPERDGRRCVDHPNSNHELICLTCMGLSFPKDSGDAAPAQGWQPIETAPKDGTWILGHVPTWTRPDLFIWADDDDSPQGFWDVGDRTCRSTAFEQPTHWMPLQAPPGSPTAEEKGCFVWSIGEQ